MRPGPDYRQLAARVRAGDRGAFDELVHAHWRPVLGFLWRRLLRDAAEEVAQTVFVNVYRAVRGGGGADLGSAEAWSKYLFAAARNALRQRWRETGAAPQSLDGPDGDDAWSAHVVGRADDAGAATGTESAEARRALEDCLDRLDRADRELVWRHFVDGRSKRDLARELARPESSLRLDMGRLVQQLRRCLEAKGAAP